MKHHYSPQAGILYMPEESETAPQAVGCKLDVSDDSGSLSITARHT